MSFLFALLIALGTHLTPLAGAGMHPASISGGGPLAAPGNDSISGGGPLAGPGNNSISGGGPL